MASPVGSRPPLALAAMGLSAAIGLLLFLPNLDLYLKTQALMATVNTLVPAGARGVVSPIPAPIITLAVLAPLLIGLVFLYAYGRLAFRIWLRDPKSVSKGMTFAVILIVLSFLGIGGNMGVGRLEISTPLVLMLNIGLVALLMTPPVRAYLKPAGAPAGAAGAAPPAAPPPPQYATPPPPQYAPPPPQYPPPAPPAPGKRFCPQCGQPLAPAANFCASCGWRV